ncbi:hypothetical protein GCM10009768_26310 [Leucobacter iarius]|uniref:Uncharacterized protein n=1 Tax=Leucobacter iarius TaxID=333963 RepID=A0ABN2LRB4_9MICO
MHGFPHHRGTLPAYREQDRYGEHKDVAIDGEEAEQANESRAERRLGPGFSRIHVGPTGEQEVELGNEANQDDRGEHRVTETM